MIQGIVYIPSSQNTYLTKMYAQFFTYLKLSSNRVTFILEKRNPMKKKTHTDKLS